MTESITALLQKRKIEQMKQAQIIIDSKVKKFVAWRVNKAIEGREDHAIDWQSWQYSEIVSMVRYKLGVCMRLHPQVINQQDTDDIISDVILDLASRFSSMPSRLDVIKATGRMFYQLRKYRRIKRDIEISLKHISPSLSYALEALEAEDIGEEHYEGLNQDVFASDKLRKSGEVNGIYSDTMADYVNRGV